MVNLSELSKKSGLPFWVLRRAISCGVDPTILDFCVYVGLRFQRAFVTASDIRQWCEVGGLSSEQVDLLIRDLVLTEMEASLCGAFGVVGTNPPDRSQGTGFHEEAEPRKSRFGKE